MADRGVQRRLAAILAADVAGYTRLMEEDTEGTVAAWSSARDDVIDPAVTEHLGRTVKLTGDGFLAEFPTVQDAVRCAIAMQEALLSNSLDFRMGVNLGDIIDDGRDIHGEGVNIAARIESLADVGGINISGDVYNQVKNRIEVTYEDRGEQTVKNVSDPVRVFAIHSHAAEAGENGLSERSNTDKPSIAVLPFDNLSDDPQQEYFSDGLSEDLITDLSKFSNLYVAARNSSFSFKDQMLDIKFIAEKLSVKFVLEGSVRKMGDKIRINAQLINALDGDHLWAERYDGVFEEVFDFQDRIREEIIAALKVQFNAGDQIEQNRPRNAEAYNFYLRGRADYYKYTPDDLAQAEDNLSQAIAIDPNMSEAHAYLSRCISGRFIQNWSGHDGDLDRAIEMAERAIALDENSSLGYTMLAWAQAFARNVEQSKANFEKAIELDPNNSEAFATYALAMPFFGDPRKSLEILDRALEIDPLGHPNADMVKGQCYFLTNKYEEAERCFKKVIENSPEFMPARLHLAANYIEMNKLEEAVEEIQKILKITPDLTLDAAHRIYPFVKEDHKERFFGALQKAGLPDD